MLGALGLSLFLAVIFNIAIFGSPAAFAQGGQQQQLMISQKISASNVFTMVQSKWGTATGSGTTVSVTLASAPTAGNAVVCGVELYDPSLTVSSAADNAGSPNSYTVAAHAAGNAATVGANLIYLLSVPSGAGATITATASATITFTSNIVCTEFHRTSGTWVWDTQATANGSGSSTVNTPSITGAAAGEILYALAGTGGAQVSATNNSPWTEGDPTAHGIEPSSDHIAGNQYILSSSGSSTAINITLTSTGNGWNAVVGALK